jgi:tetratricopeptide (TPR) repeat protein
MKNPRNRLLRRAVGLVLAGLLSAATPARSQTLPPVITPTGDAALDVAIAERLALLATDSTLAPDTQPTLLRQASAMFELATQYQPSEFRFARAHADVLLRLGDQDRALAALQRARALDPKDQVTMIQFIDLNANKMETTDQKLAYYRQVVDAASIAPEVRSHAAVLLTDIYAQRSQDAQAVAALNQALELNPQNLAALAIRYQMASSSGEAIERVRAKGAQLQASPADVVQIIEMARECVAAGDYENATDFYALGIGLLNARRQSPPIEEVVDFVAAEFLKGSTETARPFIEQGLGVIKDDGRLYLLQLLADQFDNSNIDERPRRIDTARGVYLAQLAGVSQLLNEPDKKEMPATSPAVPLPDVAADVAKLKADDARLTEAYAIALAEQLWFDLYFRAAPVDDTHIAALATLIGEQDPLVVRFQGWKLLGAGQIDQAKLKFEAIADRDGFAQLGLIAVLFQEQNAERARALLSDLIKARPAGMVGAFAAVAAKQQNIAVAPSEAEAQIAQVASAVRRPVFEAVTNPRSVYLLTASPVKLSFGVGEPLLAKVTLLNTGRQPVTIGPGGFIESRFTVDLEPRGDVRRVLPAVVFGQWTGAVRLLPRQSISTVVRVDTGRANLFFQSYPTPLISVAGTVITNPLIAESGSVPAPGGQQTSIGSVMERRSSPLYVEAFRAKLLETVSQGTPVERLNAMELVAITTPLLRSQNASADARALAETFDAALSQQLAAEPVPEVKAWTQFRTVTFRGDTDVTTQNCQTLAAQDLPLAKACALIAARALPEAQRKSIAQAVLDTSPAEPILDFARAVLEQPDLLPPTPETETPPSPMSPSSPSSTPIPSTTPTPAPTRTP